jgi:FkbM family methyltransferase
MNVLKKLARQFGYDLRKHYKVPTTTAEATMMNVINHYQIDLVLDVGANVGQFGKQLRKEGYEGELHSFEPVSNTFKQLEAACSSDPKWHCHQEALGATSGKMEINVMDSSDFSSFRTPSEFGKNRYKKLRVIGTEEINVSTVTEFLTRHNLTGSRTFLKMDTQGYDLDVLEGAEGALGNILAMQSEISLTPLYEGMPTYLESLKAYNDHGYAVAGLHPVNKSEDLSIIEIDCLVVSRR